MKSISPEPDPKSPEPNPEPDPKPPSKSVVELEGVVLCVVEKLVISAVAPPVPSDWKAVVSGGVENVVPISVLE